MGAIADFLLKNSLSGWTCCCWPPACSYFGVEICARKLLGLPDGNVQMSSAKCRGCTGAKQFELHLIATVNLQYKEISKMLEKKTWECESQLGLAGS